MVRFLLLLLGLFFARLLWGAARLLLAGRRAERVAGGASGASPGSAPSGTEFRGAVVRCEQCDLHVPEQRAVTDGGRTFCSEACRAAAGS